MRLGMKSDGLLRKVLTGKSIFIVGRGCKGYISCENETRDLRVMREWNKWEENALEWMRYGAARASLIKAQSILGKRHHPPYHHISHGRTLSQSDTQRILSTIFLHYPFTSSHSGNIHSGPTTIPAHSFTFHIHISPKRPIKILRSILVVPTITMVFYYEFTLSQNHTTISFLGILIGLKNVFPFYLPHLRSTLYPINTTVTL